MGKFKVAGRNMRGYQDKYCIYESLDRWEQRNIDMDLLAKSLMFDKRKRVTRNKLISVAPVNEFTILINNKKISGNYVNAIHDTIQGNKLVIYWNNQGRFTVEQNKYID